MVLSGLNIEIEQLYCTLGELSIEVYLLEMGTLTFWVFLP